MRKSAADERTPSVFPLAIAETNTSHPHRPHRLHVYTQFFNGEHIVEAGIDRRISPRMNIITSDTRKNINAGAGG